MAQAAVKSVGFNIAGGFGNIEINNGLHRIKHKQHIKILTLTKSFFLLFPYPEAHGAKADKCNAYYHQWISVS